MFRSSLYITFVILLGMSQQLFSQVQTAHSIGDTIYRYTTKLDRSFDRFAAINLQLLQFPCVDQFRVIPSSMTDTDYELYKPGYRELYELSATKLFSKGYQRPEPFMGKANNLMFFNKSVPIVRSTRKDDFYERSSNSFLISYDLSDLTEELKEWAALKGISEIRVSGQLNTKSNFKQPDVFNNLYEDIEGFVIENVWNYQLSTIEIKKGKWETISRDSDDLLKHYFADQKHRFLSFYDFDTMAEIARLGAEPDFYFQYNTKEKFGRHLECDHLGESVYIYPNPTFGALKAKFSMAVAGTYRFAISNIIGKTLWETELQVRMSQQQMNIELPGLSKGVYLYKILNPAGEIIQSRRLIIVDP